MTFNGHLQSIGSIEDLGVALDRFDTEPEFELWAFVHDGPSLCMLRNRPNAWLMYLRCAGDSGATSLGEPNRDGMASYTLSNSQTDEYPLAWCIELEQCYKAITSFYVNEGARPEWINWQEISRG